MQRAGRRPGSRLPEPRRPDANLHRRPPRPTRRGPSRRLTGIPRPRPSAGPGKFRETRLTDFPARCKTPPRLLPVLDRPPPDPHLDVIGRSRITGEAADALSGGRHMRSTGFTSPAPGTRLKTVAREVGGRARKRRKEVALGRLRTLTILLTLGAWGAATEGAPPRTQPTRPARRPERPCRRRPSTTSRVESACSTPAIPANAAKYLKVASDYRDQLQPGRAGAARRLSGPAEARPGGPGGPARSRRPTASAAGGPGGGRPSPLGPGRRPPIRRRRRGAPRGPPTSSRRPGGSSRPPASRCGWATTTRRPRSSPRSSRCPSSGASSTRPRPSWPRRSPRPAPRWPPASPPGPTTRSRPGPAQGGPRAAGQQPVRAGRGHRAGRQLLGPRPTACGRTSPPRSPPPRGSSASATPAATPRSKVQPSMGVYDVLVSEARHLMAAGQLDQAEAKARQALRMNVVPALTADRAEAVLNDIGRRPRQDPAGRPGRRGRRDHAGPEPVARPTAGRAASVVAERQANELLAKDQSDAAAAKFAEADRLRALEMAQPPAADRRRGRAAALTRGPEGRRPPRRLEPPRPAPTPPPRPPSTPSRPPPVPSRPGRPDAAPPALTTPAPRRRRCPPPTPPGPAGRPRRSPPMPLRPATRVRSCSPRPGPSSPAATTRPPARRPPRPGTASYGVEPQADEMLAQIALSEQGGALAVYEAALDALRKNDVDRARALLTEVAASGATAGRRDAAEGPGPPAEAPQGQRAAARPPPPTSPPRTPSRSRPSSSTPRSAPRSPRPGG